MSREATVLLFPILAAGTTACSASRRGVAADREEGRRVIERRVSIAWLSALVAICLAVVSFAG